MQIIPVIDILDGQTVRAVAGNRAAYRPVVSCLTPSADPLAVADALLDLAPFPAIYVADLDAITKDGDRRNLPMLKRLGAGLIARGCAELWLDAGNAAWCGDFVSSAAALGLRVVPVTGSESLPDEEQIQADGVLSLDYRNGCFLGPAGLDDDAGAWPHRLIVMDLSAVGVGAGPALARIDALMATAQSAGRSDIAFYAAGGVRDEADLHALAEHRVCGVLLASAVHNGRLGKSTLKHFLS